MSPDILNHQYRDVLKEVKGLNPGALYVNGNEMRERKKSGRKDIKQNAPGKELFSVSEVLENLKACLGIKSNKDLAGIMGVQPNTISTWKKRNSLDYGRLIALGKRHRIDFNILFSNNVFEPEKESIIAVPSELQYQYVSQREDEEFISGLPRYRFPFSPGEGARAFQATDFSSHPAFRGVTYVVGKRVDNLATITEGKMFIFVNRKQGIFIGRALRDREHRNVLYVVTGDGKIASNVRMDLVDIVEIWKVNNIVFNDFVD